MSIAMGPCACQGCGRDLYWFRLAWHDRRRLARYPNRIIGPVHLCRGLCGAFMPTHGDRCARKARHRYEHRSAYAMANARRKGLVAA